MLYCKRISSLFLPLTMLSASPAFCIPVTLGDAANYNGFFFNDFSSTPNDSQGSLAVGGNANLTGYTVNTAGEASPALVVGGNVVQSGGDVSGDAFINGSYTASGGGSIHGTLNQGSSLPVSFSETYQLLNNLSFDLSLAGTHATNTFGKVELTGDGSHDQQIFNLHETDFESAWGFFGHDIEQSQEIIVNVSGQHIDIDAADYLLKADDWSWIGNDSHILYNFFEAETIQISSAFHGSILATNADIYANGGSVDGQVFANSWLGATQLNLPLFAHNQEPENVTNVSEPASIWLLMLGLSGLALRKRKSP